MNKKLYWLSAALIVFTLTATSCEEEEEPTPEQKNEQQEQQEPEKPSYLDANGNAAIIKVYVLDYDKGVNYATDEYGERILDENGEYETYEYCFPEAFVGKTVYMFDDEDFSDRKKALLKTITDVDGLATFELKDDFFTTDNMLLYFAIYDDDNKVLGHGGLPVKRGKETATVIDTEGKSVGALYSYNLVKTYELKQVIKEQQFTLRNNNSGLKMPVDLPENTVSWYFSCNCVEASANNGVLGLFAELSKFFDKTGGLVSGVIDKLTKPTGTAECNIYLINGDGERSELRKGFTAGIVDETRYVNGTCYLEFEKPSWWSNGISIKFEVVALTVEQ